MPNDVNRVLQGQQHSPVFLHLTATNRCKRSTCSAKIPELGFQRFGVCRASIVLHIAGGIHVVVDRNQRDGDDVDHIYNCQTSS